MISTQMMRAFGIATPIIIAVVLLFGIPVSVSENLFNTGITAGTVLGIAAALLALAIYKYRI